MSSDLADLFGGLATVFNALDALSAGSSSGGSSSSLLGNSGSSSTGSLG